MFVSVHSFVFYFPNEIERDDENDLNMCDSAL